MATANDFFPAADTAEWHFVETSSQQRPVFSFRAHDTEDGRAITLDAPDHRFTGFFDRMTATAQGLKLQRLHFTNQVVDIPPWLLTLGPEQDRVENVLPSSFDGSFGTTIYHPYTGVTTRKTLTDTAWTIDVLISAAGGNVLEATLRFAKGIGLCAYSGQFFGTFFFYERLDEPACTQ